MDLAQKLDAIREGAKKRVSEEVRELMARATKELRDSGALDHVIAVGTRLPDFALANQHGLTVRSEELLARGPLVLTFFRGSW